VFVFFRPNSMSIQSVNIRSAVRPLVMTTTQATELFHQLGVSLDEVDTTTGGRISTPFRATTLPNWTPHADVLFFTSAYNTDRAFFFSPSLENWPRWEAIADAVAVSDQGYTLVLAVPLGVRPYAHALYTAHVVDGSSVRTEQIAAYFPYEPLATYDSEGQWEAPDPLELQEEHTHS
jgi:hypothetical protein